VEKRGERVNHVFIVTHTDLDGAGSAAAALRILGRSPEEATVIFAEPYNLDRKLGELAGHVSSGDLVIIADLGVNSESFRGVLETVKAITSSAARVEWYDHHVWSDEEAGRIKSAGVLLSVDRSTCATGVVVHHMSRRWSVEPDKFLLELEAAVCAADLWRWDHHLAPKLFRVAGDRSDDEWRMRIINKFYSGTLWDDEMEAKLEEYVNAELEGYRAIMKATYVKENNGVRIAAAYKAFRGPPGSSMIGALLLARYDADIAVIVRSDGGVSLRSRRVNVQRIAKALGGGGHPQAAGARIRMPLLVRLASTLYPKAAAWYASRAIAEAYTRLGAE